MHPARLTFLSLGLLPALAAAQHGGIYQEKGGLVVVEFESTPAHGGWSEETSASGFTFQSYYRWDGGDLFGTPGVDILRYRVNLKQAGEWFLALRNRHDHPDDTEENDVWVRADGGTWFKLFSNGPGTVGAWNWDSRFDIAHDNQPPASWNLSAGEHLIEFSGRSQNFKIDRFHLHLAGHPDANDETVPESIAFLGKSYCGPGVPNSSGMSGRTLAWGSTFVAKNQVRLQAVDLPVDKFGYFLVGSSSDFVPNAGGSQGNLCVGGNVGRFANQVESSGSAGVIDAVVDLNSLPTNPPSAVQPGERWYFQLWHRDSNPGPTSNFTLGRMVLFQ